MPIVVTCPTCATRLSAPDAATGKYVQCPKPGCGTLVSVPAVVEGEVAEPPRPKPRPRWESADDEDDRPRTRRRWDDDEDDYEFDRRRRRRQGGGAGKALAVVGIVIGGLVLLGGVGYGVYALASKKEGSGSDSAEKGAPSGLPWGGSGSGLNTLGKIPPGWQQFSYPKDGFRAYLPGEPFIQGDGGYTEYWSPDPRGGGGAVDTCVFLQVIHFGGTATDAQKREILAHARAGHGGSSSVRQVTWAGQKAEEVTTGRDTNPDVGEMGGAVIRTMIVGDTAYIAVVGSVRSGRARRDHAAAFFDNFELLK